MFDHGSVLDRKNPLGTIAAFVKEYGITHILLGRSHRAWYQRLFSHSILDRLQNEVRGVDIVVVATD